jgi:hypothetical protein
VVCNLKTEKKKTVTIVYVFLLTFYFQLQKRRFRNVQHDAFVVCLLLSAKQELGQSFEFRKVVKHYDLLTFQLPRLMTAWETNHA